MKIPIRSIRPNIRLANQEKTEEREIWHKLVVKIISWKSGLLEGGLIKATDKITPKEWNTYHKGRVKISSDFGKDKVRSSLKEIKAFIKKQGGFAE